MEKPLVIVNPRSGGGLSERRWSRLAGALTDGLGPFEVSFTKAPRDATDLARAAAVAGRRLVVAFGGDGTTNEVADGLAGAGMGTELGIVPRGTGGDFRRSLELPSEVRGAGERIRNGAPHLIDLGRATYTGADGARESRYFINVASFGFSAAIAHRANQSSKRLGGRVSFFSAAMRGLATRQNAEINVTTDQGQRRLTTLLGAVGNGRFFGGGMNICPDAKLDDGLLQVVLIGDYSTVDVLARIHRLYAGTHLSLPDIHHQQTARVEVEAVDPETRVPLELDGETVGFLPASFEVVPRALALRA